MSVMKMSSCMRDAETMCVRVSVCYRSAATRSTHVHLHCPVAAASHQLYIQRHPVVRQSLFMAVRPDVIISFHAVLPSDTHI